MSDNQTTNDVPPEALTPHQRALILLSTPVQVQKLADEIAEGKVTIEGTFGSGSTFQLDHTRTADEIRQYIADHNISLNNITNVTVVNDPRQTIESAGENVSNFTKIDGIVSRDGIASAWTNERTGRIQLIFPGHLAEKVRGEVEAYTGQADIVLSDRRNLAMTIETGVPISATYLLEHFVPRVLAQTNDRIIDIAGNITTAVLAGMHIIYPHIADDHEPDLLGNIDSVQAHGLPIYLHNFAATVGNHPASPPVENLKRAMQTSLLKTEYTQMRAYRITGMERFSAAPESFPGEFPVGKANVLNYEPFSSAKKEDVLSSQEEFVAAQPPGEAYDMEDLNKTSIGENIAGPLGAMLPAMNLFRQGKLSKLEVRPEDVLKGRLAYPLSDIKGNITQLTLLGVANTIAAAHRFVQKQVVKGVEPTLEEQRASVIGPIASLLPEGVQFPDSSISTQAGRGRGRG